MIHIRLFVINDKNRFLCMVTRVQLRLLGGARARNSGQAGTFEGQAKSIRVSGCWCWRAAGVRRHPFGGTRAGLDAELARCSRSRSNRLRDATRARTIKIGPQVGAGRGGGGRAKTGARRRPVPGVIWGADTRAPSPPAGAYRWHTSDASPGGGVTCDGRDVADDRKA